MKIVFAAGANHEIMFEQFVSPIVPRLIKKYGNKFSFSFYGVHPDMSMFEDKINVEYIGSMPLEQYRKAIQEGYYDIGIAPLETNEFTKCKYYNKYIEYTIAGFPGIYSNVPPYTLVIKDGINGFLADNTPEAWFTSICRAIDDVSLRRSCYARAYDHILTNMNADLILKKLINDIPEIENTHVEDKGPIIITLKIRFALIRFIECIYLVGEYIKDTGITGTLKKIKSYTRDSVKEKGEKLGQ